MIKSGAREASEVQRLFMQYWVAAAILAAANLGIADALDDQPRPAQEIARSLSVDPNSFLRLLRSLASIGIFREGDRGQFVNTPLSAALRDDALGNARSMIRMFGLKSIREAMSEYEYAIRTGRSAFEMSHGAGVNIFECFLARPDEAATYNAAMACVSEMSSSIVHAYDFSDIDLLIDIGGGQGGFLADILQINSRQRGILFDLPSVVTEAAATLTRHGVDSRCTVRGGDMRQDVPGGGGGYILKNILHGYGDADAVALLRRIREKGVDGVKVLIIENVMPDGNGPAPCKVFDLFLLLGGNGSRVRSEPEFRSLLKESGFMLSRVVPILGNTCLLEGEARVTC